jgi:hypothetical protein
MSAPFPPGHPGHDFPAWINQSKRLRVMPVCGPGCRCQQNEAER